MYYITLAICITSPSWRHGVVLKNNHHIPTTNLLNLPCNDVYYWLRLKDPSKLITSSLIIKEKLCLLAQNRFCQRSSRSKTAENLLVLCLRLLASRKVGDFQGKCPF